MHAFAVVYLTVAITCVSIVQSSNPKGSTGCSTWSESVQWCWRFCSGGSGAWCYTGKNCTQELCFLRDTCAGYDCQSYQKDCVQYCTGSDADDADCSNTEGNTMIACEGNSVVLQCTAEKTVNIISANYGRTEPGATVCPHCKIETTKCYSSNSYDKVVERCQGKQNCELEASNSFFGDPCEGTYKYLNVQFKCV